MLFVILFIYDNAEVIYRIKHFLSADFVFKSQCYLEMTHNFLDFYENIDVILLFLVRIAHKEL